MDNITHSLIGLAAGEAIARASKKPRLPILLASVLANNIPDIDVFSRLFLSDPLLNLLHHRGHTHTFLLAPLEAIIILLLLSLIWKKKPDIPWPQVQCAAFLGVFLHIFADFWNSYGVVPLWPFSNHWIYGDMIFIVEPWIWILLIPALFLQAQAKRSKWLYGIALAGLLALVWSNGLVPLALRIVFTLVIPLSFFSAQIFREKRIYIHLFGLLFLLASMKGISLYIKEKYAEQGAEHALTPLPGNPFCWSSLQANNKNEIYSVQRSLIAPFPSLIAVDSCPQIFSAENPLLTKSEKINTAGQSFFGTFRAPAEQLKKIAENCRGNAFLRFVRIPFWSREGDSWQVADLRFDRRGSNNFASFQIADQEPNCPNFVPPWIAPFHPQNQNP